MESKLLFSRLSLPFNHSNHCSALSRYRAPDVLLGSRKYSTPVDIWSIGCIFAEMINGNPLFTGTSEDTQLDTIFRHLGTPDESTFPGISELPDWRSDFPNYPPPDSLHVLVPNLEQSGVELLQVDYVVNRIIQDCIVHMKITANIPSFCTYIRKSLRFPRACLITLPSVCPTGNASI